jgi:flagellar biosynthesis component FlhA
VTQPKHHHPSRALRIPQPVLTLGIAVIAVVVAIVTLAAVLTTHNTPKVPPPVLITVERTRIITAPPSTRTITVTPTASDTGGVITTFGSG